MQQLCIYVFRTFSTPRPSKHRGSTLRGYLCAANSGLSHAEHDPVLDPHDASTPIRLDDLGIEQLGLRPPARLGLGACGLAALGWHPLAIMRDERGEVLPNAVG